MYRQSLEGFRETGDPRGEGRSLLGLARIMAEEGDLEGAMQHLRDCLSMEIERDDSPAMIEVLETMVNVSLRRGQWQEAQAKYARFWMRFG